MAAADSIVRLRALLPPLQYTVDIVVDNTDSADTASPTSSSSSSESAAAAAAAAAVAKMLLHSSSSVVAKQSHLAARDVRHPHDEGAPVVIGAGTGGGTNAGVNIAVPSGNGV